MAKKKAKKPAKKPAAKKKGGRTYISKAPIRRLMKNEGAGLVAEAAVVVLIAELTKAGQNITKTAVKLVKEDKRKRITGQDIVNATRV